MTLTAELQDLQEDMSRVLNKVKKGSQTLTSREGSLVPTNYNTPVQPYK